MEWLLWGFGVLCVLVLLGLLFAWRTTAPRRLGVAPEVAGELDALGAQLAAEHHRETGAPVVVVLERLRSRGVPLLSISQDGGIRRQFLLGFADGTCVVARPRGVADAGTLLLILRRNAVVIRGWADESDAYVIELAWRDGSSRWEAVATGGRALSA